jgi:AcrR family transcriptional regulator
MVRSITEYYAQNREYFIFSLIQVLGNKDTRHNMIKQMERRGVFLDEMREYISKGNDHPTMVFMARITAIFYTALFHKIKHTDECAAIPDQEINVFVAQTEKKIVGGLGFNREAIDSLNYGRLEDILGTEDEPYEDNGLLKAVAGVVAEMGPWNASMDMVARRSGLSKSGLYAHFKSKQDMLGQLFYTEINHIARRADAHVRMSAVPAEQLYLVILSIADYFRRRPAILIALDWIRIQRMDIHFAAPRLIYDIFADLRLHDPEGAGDTSPELITHWILFLIVSALMHRPNGMDFADFSNRSIRMLFRFISLGIEGW